MRLTLSNSTKFAIAVIAFVCFFLSEDAEARRKRGRKGVKARAAKVARQPASKHLKASEYVALEPMDSLPSTLSWSPPDRLFHESGKSPFVILRGKVDKGTKVSLNGKDIVPVNGNFNFKFDLPTYSKAVPLTINSGDETKTFRLLVHWKKVPPRIGLRVREKGKIVDLSRGVNMFIEPSAFAQLYRDGAPADEIGLGETDLSFKIVASNVDKTAKWAISIFNERNRRVTRGRGRGMPPSKLAWKRLIRRNLPPGKYKYYMDLMVKGQVYRGTASTFEMTTESRQKYYLTDFQLSTVAGFQGSAGQSFSGMFSWNPTWMFSDNFGIRGNFTVSGFKKNTNGIFIATGYQALLSYKFGNGPLVVEAGGGAQTWFDFGGTKASATLNIGFTDLFRNLKIVERIFGGYTMIFADTQVHIANLGVGIRL